MVSFFSFFFFLFFSIPIIINVCFFIFGEEKCLPFILFFFFLLLSHWTLPLPSSSLFFSFFPRIGCDSVCLFVFFFFFFFFAYFFLEHDFYFLINLGDCNIFLVVCHFFFFFNWASFFNKSI